MIIANIINNKVFEVFDADKIPTLPPYLDGTLPLLVDVTDKNVHIGMIYNPEDGSFTEPPEPEPQPEPTPSITMEELNQNQLTIMEALTDLYMTVSEMGVE